MELQIRKLNIKTRPEAQPIAMVDAVTADDNGDDNGRYSKGSQSKFSELCVIHIPSELKP